MKLELTLKCELTGIFLFFLLLNHSCGQGSRRKIRMGLAHSSGASLEELALVFWKH